MNPGNIQIPKHPIWPTVVILVIGALIGAVLGWVVTLVGAAVTLSQLHPIYAVLYGPAIFGTSSLVLLGALAVSPFWTLGLGHVCARMYGGKSGLAASHFGVTFFSEGHPISQATRRMTDTLGIPPVAYIGWYDAPDINAFAMGTDPRHALVALSRGAIENLTTEQLDAVIAHELGHVANNDMVRATYARGIQRSLTFFLLFRGFRLIARWLFTPLSELEILRFSRAREFTADAVSARLTSPQAMIAVLETLQAQDQSPVTRGYGTAMMSGGFAAGWFSTHPPLQRRIAALKALEAAPSLKTASDPSFGGGVDAERIRANLVALRDAVSSRERMMAIAAAPRTMRWVLGIAGTMIWLALLVVVASEYFSFGNAVLMFLLSGVLADALTALGHFGLGYVSPSSRSVFGGLARQMRAHRDAPALDPGHTLSNLAVGSLAALPFAVLGLWIGTLGDGYGTYLLSGTVTAMGIWLLFSLQIHAYVHMGGHVSPEAFREQLSRIAEMDDPNEQVRQFDRLFDTVQIPPLIRRLQKARIVLNPAQHARHHSSFQTGFSLINGWSDAIMEPVFRRVAERLNSNKPYSTHPL